jgi:hypothetical protein
MEKARPMNLWREAMNISWTASHPWPSGRDRTTVRRWWTAEPYEVECAVLLSAPETCERRLRASAYVRVLRFSDPYE